MNKKLFLSFAAVAALALFLFACSGDGDAESGVGPGATASPVETNANLLVTVQDQSTGNFLPGATVTLLSTGESKPVPESGSVTFSNVEVGTHEVRIDAPNYASVIISQTTTGNLDGGVHIATNTAIEASLYPTTAGLKGYVFYYDSEGKVAPFSNATIRITFYNPPNGEFVEKYAEAPTNSNGLYEFTGLPAVGMNYEIIAITSDFNTYDINPGVSLLKDIVAIPALPEVLTENKNAAVFQILDYTRVVDETTPVIFTFSDNVNRNLIKSGTIQISGSQAANVIWRDNELEIAPIAKWKATSGSFTVRFAGLQSSGLTLLSVNGKALTGDSWTSYYTVTVEKTDLQAAAVDAVIVGQDTLSYNVSQFTLKWNKIAGAEGYEIYIKDNGSDEFKQLPYNGHSYSASTGTATDTSVTVSLSSYTLNGTTSNAIRDRVISYRVRAVNSSYKSSLEDATEAVAKDWYNNPNFYFAASSEVDKHSIASVRNTADSVVWFKDSSGTEFPDFNSYYSLGDKLGNATAYSNFAIGKIIFSKPMDTTATLTLGFTDSTGTSPAIGVTGPDGVLAKKLLINPVWQTDEQTLLLYVSTAAGNIVPAGDVNVVWSISGLKSKLGVPFKTKYHKGADANNSKVNIRFTATVVADLCSTDPSSSPSCTGYCATSTGIADYANCPAEACGDDPNNGACVGYSGYCETTTGLSDYTNCFTEICISNSSDTSCVSYCAVISNFMSSFSSGACSTIGNYCNISGADTDLCDTFTCGSSLDTSSGCLCYDYSSAPDCSP
jgi:hypothetical protein